MEKLDTRSRIDMSQSRLSPRPFSGNSTSNADLDTPTDINRSRTFSIFDNAEKRPSFDFDDFISHLQQTQGKIGRSQHTVQEFKERLKKTKFPGISKEEAMYYVEAFTIFDLDGNGAINEEELVHAMNTLEMNMTAHQVKKMIQTVDVDGNGDVSLEEFIRLMVSIRSKNKFISSDSQIREAFVAVDVDKDGLIGANDLVALFVEVGEVITFETAQEMIMAVSRNKDDPRVSIADFYVLVKESDL